MVEITKKKILEAAAKCFSERGYTKTTMDKIAEEAGVSKGTLYWYFKSKEDLFVELKVRHIARVLKQLEELFAQKKTFDLKLMEAIAMYFSSLVPENREVARLNAEFLAEATKIPKLNKMLRDQYERIQGLITSTIEEAIEKGELRKDIDPKLISMILLAMLDGLELQWGILEIDFDWERIKTTILDVLMRGLKPKE
jgi:AcrR family transcriptional regulator